MASKSQVPTPPPDESGAGAAASDSVFSRPSPSQAAADAIPILVDDTYHLFHLTTPPFTRHHPPRLRSSWWHLRSTDLVHWTRDRQPCITPGEAGADVPDADGAWTGGAVLGPDGAMNVFYTGYNLSQNGRQVILRTRAQGKDKDEDGAAFAPLPGHAITFHGSGRDQLEDVDFRDPFVFFHAGEQRYWMVVASRLARGPYWTRGCIALLTSTDLDAWTFAPQPLYRPNDLFCPECPELFYLPAARTWYLVYSRFHAPDAGTVYRVADSPYGPFRVPQDGSHGRLDGRRWYAAKSCPAAASPDDGTTRDSTRIFFGWIGDYVDDEGKWLWGGDMGVPREVSAGPEGYLRVGPAAAAVVLAEKTSTAVPETAIPARRTLSSAAVGGTTVLPLDLGQGADDFAGLLTVSFHVARCDAHAFGVVLQPDAEECGYRLQFVPFRGGASATTRYTVALLTDLPPLDDFWADQYNQHRPRPVDGPELVRHEHVVLGADGVRMFLRGPLVEVFCGGRSLSFRLPRDAAGTRASGPTTETSVLGKRRLSWFVQDGEVALDNVAVRFGGRLDQMTLS